MINSNESRSTGLLVVSKGTVDDVCIVSVLYFVSFVLLLTSEKSVLSVTSYKFAFNLI